MTLTGLIILNKRNGKFSFSELHNLCHPIWCSSVSYIARTFLRAGYITSHRRCSQPIHGTDKRQLYPLFMVIMEQFCGALKKRLEELRKNRENQEVCNTKKRQKRLLQLNLLRQLIDTTSSLTDLFDWHDKRSDYFKPIRLGFGFIGLL